MSKALSISLIIVAFVSGIGVGYTLTPEYSAYKINPVHGEGLGKPDKYLNLRFTNGMIAHHMSAIYMLEQVRKESQRSELTGLAEVVIKLDTQGIKDLYALKARQYGDQRPVKNFNQVALGAADGNFDLRFLNAMVIHHEEAIAASKEALVKSTDKEVLETAGAVNNLLSENLKQLLSWREAWYGVK